MRKKYLGYGIQESYAAYGLSRERAKTILKECRAGKHGYELQEAVDQVDPFLSKWLIESIAGGESFPSMAIGWELGRAEAIPCCRNAFFSRRKLTLCILDKMLREGEHGRL